MKLFPNITSALFIANRRRLEALLPPNAMVLMRSALPVQRNGDQYYPYRQESNFFWLTGLAHDTAQLILFPDCPNPVMKELLFIPAYDPVKATWEGHMLTQDEAKAISGIEKCHHSGEFKPMLHECMAYADSVYLLSNEYTKFLPEDETQDIRFDKFHPKGLSTSALRTALPVVASVAQYQTARRAGAHSAGLSHHWRGIHAGAA